MIGCERMNTAIYKTALEKELGTLQEELRRMGIQDPENTSNWIARPEAVGGEADPNVAADKVEDWNEKHAITEELETRYNNIKRALTKIENDTYGTCEIGKEPIREERLSANPAARTCEKHLEEGSTLPT